MTTQIPLSFVRALLEVILTSLTSALNFFLASEFCDVDRMIF